MGPRRLLLLGAVVACSDSQLPPDPPGSIPDPPSDNPIDVAIWPRLVAGGWTELPPAPDGELCRRMALDLIGTIPSADDTATLCDGKSAADMARGFMAHPRFREIEQRFWIRRLGADPTAMMANHIADADRIFDALAGGLPYDDFVAQLLAHPITTINRPLAAGDDVTPTVQKIFRTFLGRAASADEVADYANLLRPWRRRFEDRYDQGYGYYVNPAALDPRACRDPVLGSAACTSTLLGAQTTIEPDITAQVPPGYDQTNANLFYYELVEGDMPDALQLELEKPGRLLATRDELWDEAADFALARFTGWWRSSANEPETVLPEVRRALAEHFRALEVRDLRELYVIVLSSLLYTTSADHEGAERPPWTTGPTKLVEPEQLLDLLSRALDRPLGFCDPHTDEPIGRNFYWPDRLRIPQPTDFYGFGFDFYRDIATQLGGCIGAVAAPRSPGLPALLAHIDAARRLCDGTLLPADHDPSDLRGAGDQIFHRLAGRAPRDDERTALDTAQSACASDSACTDATRFAREVCGALVRSTAVLYY
jgi:hypothetical protein